MIRSTGLTQNSKTIWIALTRIALGVLLTWQALLFAKDASEVAAAIQQVELDEYAGFLYSIIAIVSILTLVTAILITIGLFTRIASMIQTGIIVIGSPIIYLNDFDTNMFEQMSAVILLAVLLFLMIKGSGPISFDSQIKRNKKVLIDIYKPQEPASDIWHNELITHKN